MGLSASQARLLSITARLSANELHSQQISNAKVRLANQTQQASKDYVNSLNAQKFVYTMYDAKGNSSQVAFTPAVMYAYSDLKNQYGISNSSGQLLISATDADNYKNSENIYSFLDKYGIKLNTNQLYINQLHILYGEENYTKYGDPLTGIIDDGLDQINDGKILEWIEEWNPNMTLSEYDAWMSKVALDKSYIDNAGGKYKNFINAITSEDTKLYLTWNTFKNYVDATLPAVDVYDPNKSFWTQGQFKKEGYERIQQILSHILKPADESAEFTTSDGNKIYIAANEYGDFYGNDENYLNDVANYEAAVSPLRELIKNNDDLKQQLIDFYYHTSYILAYVDENKNEHIEDNIYKYNDSWLTYIGDPYYNRIYQSTPYKWRLLMQNINPDISNWKQNALSAYNDYMDQLSTLDDTELVSIPENDPKAQWYVNLWHRINGESDINIGFDPDTQKLTYTNETSGKYWKILEDNLYTSASWLKFALEQGLVTLEQVQNYEDIENETGLKEAKWTSKIYSTCVDIQAVDDEAAIARAEAIYTRTLNDIEAKDKRYDSDIKKLDTEHNALQTEYESVKAAIDKNVERSFKAFS